MPKTKKSPDKSKISKKKSFWKNPIVYVGLVLFVTIGTFAAFNTHAAGLGPAKDVYGCPIIAVTKLPVLRQGSTGGCVKTLQLHLNVNWGYSNVAIDGVFGPITLSAVRSVQSRSHIAVDGIVGPQTWYTVLCQSPRQVGQGCIYPLF